MFLKTIQNRYKNKFTYLIRSAKTNYFSFKFKIVQMIIKETWKNLNNLIGRNKISGSIFLINNIKVTDAKIIV